MLDPQIILTQILASWQADSESQGIGETATQELFCLSTLLDLLFARFAHAHGR